MGKIIVSLSPPPTESEMLRKGFSSQQIQGLKEVKEDFPFKEFTSTHVEWMRLQFLRWRMERDLGLVIDRRLVVGER